MKYTKRLSLLSVLVAAPFLAPSNAGADHFPGTNCMPITMTQAPDIYFSKDGVTNNGSRDLWVTCPISWDEDTVNNIAQVDVAGYSDSSGAQCIVRKVINKDLTAAQAGFNTNTDGGIFGWWGLTDNFNFIFG